MFSHNSRSRLSRLDIRLQKTRVCLHLFTREDTRETLTTTNNADSVAHARCLYRISLFRKRGKEVWKKKQMNVGVTSNCKVYNYMCVSV